MAKFSCSHSLFTPSIFTTRFIFLIAIQSCQYQPNYHLHPVHLRPKGRQDVRMSGGRPAPQAMWSRSKSNVESTSKASATEKQIVSRTRRLKPFNPFVASDQGTHVLYKRKKENCRLPRAKVNGELPCFPPHAYAVIPKKLTRILLSPRVRKDGKYPNMAIAFY